MRSSFSTDFSQSDFQTSIENFPLPTDKSLVIDRRLESNPDLNNHKTHTPTHKASLSSGSMNGKSPGPLLPPSPADSTMAAARPASQTRRISINGNTIGAGDASVDKDSTMRDIDRGAPGDRAIFSDTKSASQRELARRKSQYYSDVFAQREPATSARERVGRESFVMADVRTNVIVQDEYSFITDLSYTLSSRYARPENSICVSITHSACLLFGGSFEPAYTMTITALPNLVQPTLNKRNAALIQKSMEDVLGVPPQRGLIKFAAISEENMATNGRTVLGEIEELERESKEEIHSPTFKSAHNTAGTSKSNEVRRSDSNKKDSMDSKIRGKRASMKNLRNLKTGKGMERLEAQGEEMTPPLSGITENSGSPIGKDRLGGDAPPISMGGGVSEMTARKNSYGIRMPDVPEKSDMDRRAEKAQKLGKRRSFIAAVFGKA